MPEDDANSDSRDGGAVTPDAVDDLLAATPETAYFWGRVAGDGGLETDCVTVRAGDERAADALAAIAGADRPTREVAARESAHDASVVRFEDEYELQVVGSVADRAAAALGLPVDGRPGGYRLDALTDHRPQLVRGLLEACGTVCFRESANAVGVSFVHDDDALLETVRSLLDAADPHVPTEDLKETSSGGYWFGLADGADVPAFAEWAYAGSDESGLFAADRRRKLARSVERATDRPVGELSP
ncbi:cobalamin biosynthesis protein [Halorubellus sp. JP-L1]|uniref:cobalamin biosynthesis protein n=1 Tax=Halorubellus sp. JP-L1 TaxID=2715753 RepID=UPI00140B14CC|nr:cobalamin biosynthesis protein [Halorubellus sp. JP-L1]NHN41670.1 cobalamin biosynthesis protein [Halorubellus sp. JP-L1]